MIKNLKDTFLEIITVYQISCGENKIQMASFSVQLLAPINADIVNSLTPTLYWFMDKPTTIDVLYFDVYLHQDEKEVIKRSSEARKATDQTEMNFSTTAYLTNDLFYYWTVVPKYYDEYDNEYIGQTPERPWNFRINRNSDNHPPISNL